MGRVTSLFARKVVEQVKGPADKNALLGSVGLERGDPVDVRRVRSVRSRIQVGERCLALRLSDRTLRTPNRVGDAAIATFFDAHLDDEVTKLDDTVPLPGRVGEHVSTSLSEGVPLVSEVAREFGMSARTLQRRLSEDGRSF